MINQRPIEGNNLALQSHCLEVLGFLGHGHMYKPPPRSLSRITRTLESGESWLLSPSPLVRRVFSGRQRRATTAWRELGRGWLGWGGV